MDYFDEYDDARPRYQFRGGGGGSASSSDSSFDTAVSKPHLFACLSASLLLSICAYYAFQHSYDILLSLLLWFALSLLLAPFAPSSATGGSISVGVGDPLPEPAPSVSTSDPADSSNNSNRRSRSRKQVDRSSDQTVSARSSIDQSLEQKRSEQRALEEKRKGEEEKREKEEEKDWTEEDLDLLRKQMAKYPVAGDPNRWEKIASAFKGTHGLDSVIRTAKLVQEMKGRGEDPFEQFLKKRKPVDPRAEAAKDEATEPKTDLKEIWSSGDDLALLNALKAFPKDVPLRWEKIAAAVPGKSKAGCMRRVSELKKDFRSMKASES
ncbi:DnaJ subfamily C member 2 [Rhynchospora pubera]|uniref:DnaJ subfamily C member 2 n=1 Tax=Rhynchospora pubera TaxID=906938 RepID=A0AAV8E3H1_9POAL|nr:DnaJ subfamily C member 2 [Rhynchospora pubera]